MPGQVVGMMYVPAGYVKIAGATVQRNDYIRLVNLADKYSLWTTDTVNNPGKFGIGDGTTTMVLPDWRGVVRRFIDDGKGYDVNRVLGSFQGDLIVSHTHTHLRVAGSASWGPGNSNGSVYNANYTSTTGATGGTETRMKNIAEMAVMRY